MSTELQTPPENPALEADNPDKPATVLAFFAGADAYFAKREAWAASTENVPPGEWFFRDLIGLARLADDLPWSVQYARIRALLLELGQKVLKYQLAGTNLSNWPSDHFGHAVDLLQQHVRQWNLTGEKIVAPDSGYDDDSARKIRRDLTSLVGGFDCIAAGDEYGATAVLDRLRQGPVVMS